MDSNLIIVGKLGKVHGLKGFIRFFTVYEDLFSPKILINFLCDRQKHTFIPEQTRRDPQKGLFLKFRNFDDRTAIEKNVGKDLFSFEKEFPPLPKGKYYFFQLSGLEVCDISFQKIGTISHYQKLAHHDLYEVTLKNGNTFLIPAVSEFIKSINLEEKRMIIQNFTELMKIR